MSKEESSQKPQLKVVSLLENVQQQNENASKERSEKLLTMLQDMIALDPEQVVLSFRYLNDEGYEDIGVFHYQIDPDAPVDSRVFAMIEAQRVYISNTVFGGSND